MKGSTIKRGNTWTAYWFTTDPATGKRKQHSKGGFRLQKDARGHLNTILEKVDQGSWKPDAKLSIKALLEEHWLPAQRSRGLRPSTLDQYQNVVDAWIVPHVGGVTASMLTPAKVQELTETLRSTMTASRRAGLSSRSLQLTVGVLKSAYAWAVKTELLGRNPIAGVDRPRVEHKPMSAWTTIEARSFLSATRDDRLAFAWALLLTRGLRRGELCGVRWDDVDLDGGVLRVNRTRVVVDGKAIDSAPKTAAGRRTIPLDATLVARLRAHRATQAAEKLRGGGAYEDGGWLVADELGAPYYPDTISTWFDDRVKAAELRRVRLHDCRHTAASLMLASGVPVKVVSELMGHASPTITLSIYAHVMPGMAGQAGAALSASLLG